MSSQQCADILACGRVLRRPRTLPTRRRVFAAGDQPVCPVENSLHPPLREWQDASAHFAKRHVRDHGGLVERDACPEHRLRCDEAALSDDPGVALPVAVVVQPLADDTGECPRRRSRLGDGVRRQQQIACGTRMKAELQPHVGQHRRVLRKTPSAGWWSIDEAEDLCSRERHMCRIPLVRPAVGWSETRHTTGARHYARVQTR